MNADLTPAASRIWAVAVLLAVMTTGAAPADELTPNQIIEQTANTLANRVDADHERLAANPTELYALVDEVLLPAFDTRYAGGLVLGRHWRTATPEQRRAFIDTFYDFLVRSYAESVLKFRRDNIRILPPPPGEPQNPKRTVVRTDMRLDDGSTIPVNYSLRQTPKGWRIFDVNIEGISYVQNYRKQFDLEISAKGLDAVIARLQAETPAAPAPAGDHDTSPAGGSAGDSPAVTEAEGSKAAHGPVLEPGSAADGAK
jgi:phospholipid transport system substrate-binding protein